MHGRRKTDHPIVDAVYTEIDGEIQRVHLPRPRPIKIFVPPVRTDPKSDDVNDISHTILLGLIGILGLALLWSML